MSQRPNPLRPGLPFGEVVRAFGLTARALRWYEARGLFTAQRDALGRRWYDAEARRRLGLVVALRRVDVPVHEIAEILELGPSESKAALVQVLRAHRSAAAARLAELDAALADAMQARVPVAHRSSPPLCLVRDSSCR